MLKLCKIVGLFALAAATTACTSNPSSRNGMIEAPRPVSAVAASQTQLGFFPEPLATTVAAAPAEMPKLASPYKVVDVQVEVPDYLVVSEADVFLPKADIVWREDPLGNRYEQVEAIVEDALRKGTSPLLGEKEVILVARVGMFHALTEKTRNSVGGKHNVQFEYVLLDAKTRQPVTAVQKVDASLKAFGGSRAYRAMRQGQTQKVRITNHVAGIVQTALTIGSDA
ncbi:DUF6778 family protein [Neptunicoccus cionae]|uniref:ABC-type transport auxiliary lipoprotein component domain-containing protein n=1 Tax=Neptunicoccus cionae TaxID=2035344 RepID=A0A916QSH1_9RHOB|nr:DUF6778 family protein [Amylibacter cionae]GGA08342.1 hypothetical protein GCM10011498_05290 [Amylibacter cionae]